MAGALDGIRVIDFGQYIAAPFAAMVMADNGAEVIRIDPPGGPRWNNAVNAALQRGKKSIVLDLKQAEDVEIAKRLIASADVVIENFRPGVMERLGLGAKAMLAANPRLVYCSIPGFSENDPRAGVAGWEQIVSAAAGLYYPRLPAAEHEPVYTAVPLASGYAGLIASHAIVGGLIAQLRSGKGQRIEVPLFTAALHVGGADTQSRAIAKPPTPPRINRAVIRRHLCGDGRYVDLSPPLRGWGKFAETFLPRELVESGVTDIYNGDPEAIAQLLAALQPLFLSMGAHEWEVKANEEAGNGIAMCQTTEEWLNDQHALDSQCIIPMHDPVLGETKQPGYTVALSKTPPAAQGPRHVLDADHDAIIASLDQPRSHPTSREPANGDLSKVLEGIRVLDLSQVLAGPTSARILAEYGADVIKVENPRADRTLMGGQHTFVNNGKRSIVLDLKNEEAMNVFWTLLDTADVVHLNFALGVPERLGIGEADLRKRRADIIYSAVNCHALGGYREDYKGHEELGQAVTGMQTRLGGDGVPERAGRAVCDYSTGHASAFGVMLSLYNRLRTGEGQSVQAALSRSATFLQLPFMLDYHSQTWSEPRGLEAKGNSSIDRMYKTQDAWIYLAAMRPGDLTRLQQIDGLLGDVRFDKTVGRLEEQFATAPAAVWVERLAKAGIAAIQVERMDQVITSPFFSEHIGVKRHHSDEGEIMSVGPGARFEGTPLDGLFGAPPLGTHADEVLADVGLKDRMDALVASGAVVLPKTPV